MEVGRVCVKLAGREAGKKCVVVDVVDENYVLVSGPEVKRRRCNIGHLEPLEQKLEVKKGASDEDVKRALKAEPKVKPEEKPPEREEKPEEKPPEEKGPEEKLKEEPAEKAEEKAGKEG